VIARDAYPIDSVMGSCFLTGDYDPAHGIVDLERYVDALPISGRLCVSGVAVRDMVTALGWTLAQGELQDRIDELTDRNAELVAENARMRKAVASIIDITKLARIDDSWLVKR
jgi:hypothetical protein